MARSISDIAKLAGVSKTAVSIVMNGKAESHGISKATAEKIIKIARENHYSPSNLARGLRLKRTNAFGMVVPDLNNWFFSQLSQAIDNILRAQGYKLYITSSFYDEGSEHKIIQDFLSWHLDGLIVASVAKQDKEAEDVFDQKTPVVFIDRVIESKYISWVSSDNFLGSYELINHLCTQGVKQICYLGGTRNVSTLINRMDGYKQALKNNHINFDPELVFEGGATPADGYKQAQKMYKKFKGFPAAIYTSSCDFMLGLLQFIKDQCREIPKGLKICTFDDDPMLDFLNIRVHSARQNVTKMAEAALRLLNEAASDNRVKKHEIIRPDIIIR